MAGQIKVVYTFYINLHIVVSKFFEHVSCTNFKFLIASIICFRKEMAQFKVELENQFANDKASTVRLLNDQHKNEMRAVTNDMESKIRKLMMQVIF